MSKKPTATPSAEQVADVAKVIEFLANDEASQPQPDTHDNDSFWASGNPKIVIKDQPGLALAITAAGDLLLRQHAEPRDTVIIVTRHFLPQFLEDVCSLLGVRPQLWSPKK